MTTVTVHHTFTTTIASPPPTRPTTDVVPPIHLASTSSSRPLRRRWGRRRTAHVDGSRDARSIDRARGEHDDGFGFGFGSRRTSRRRRPRSSAFARVIALHSRLARIRSNARAHSSRATRAEGIRASREVVFERASEGETRARCDARTRRARGENGDAGRTGRTGRTNAFCPKRENEFQFK